MQSLNFESDVKLAMQFRVSSSDEGNAIVANTTGRLKLRKMSNADEKYWDSVRNEADKRLSSQQQ